MRAFLSLCLIWCLGHVAHAFEIQHELGTTVIAGPPDRIVVLEFSFVDALAILGVSPVGIADDNKRERIVGPYGDAIDDDWISVGTRKTPSLELIASLQPNLIIADKNRHGAAYATLSEIAPTIVLDSLGGDYADAVLQMKTIASALGKLDAMSGHLARHQKRMKDFASSIEPQTHGLSAYFGVVTPTGLFVHAPHSYSGSVLSLLNFDGAVSDSHAQVYVPTNLEQLSTLNPDMLFVGAGSQPTILDDWAQDALYQNLSAVRAGRVFRVDTHTWSRLRGMLAAEMIASDILDVLDGLK